METAQSILKKYWGYDSFRPGQEDIVRAVLADQDTLALLPTGGGKSLCYQVPALMKEGICIVISPLIALMQDQVSRLTEAGIMAAAIHAGMKYPEVRRTLDNMLHGPYKLLYVSPERLQTRLFREYLPELNISLIAVDEAHCISQWGHDFRPDYLKIDSLREVFPRVPVLALTASATETVQRDICLQLKLRKPALFRKSFERSNIFYEIKYTENKTGDLLDILRKTSGSIIVYCRSRRQTENLQRVLQQNGLASLFYHAGMQREKRNEAQESWMSNKVPVMIATTAFGMGIDKPDVRLVVHYDAPEHLEAWYQEMGRAGRDGKPAAALTLFSHSDIKRLEESIALQFPPEAYLRKVYQSVAEYLQIATGTEPDRYYDFDLADFAQKFKLQALQASYALKLLEQEGLWTMSEAVHSPATVLFTVRREELNTLMLRYPDIGYVATVLLRLYSGIYTFPTAIRLSALAKHLKMQQPEVRKALLRLQSMGIIEFNEPGEGPQMFVHHYRVDSRHLIINTARIRQLREQHEHRTKAMIWFLEQGSVCRDRILLQYFGEQKDTNCGHCDICRSKQPARKINREEVLGILQASGDTTIAQLMVQFPETSGKQVTELLRTLAEEEKIYIGAGNIIKMNR
ncbi:RecQ family ATP-dependent DNA helicase [Chitinophagaceae bacterium MMS25-I14]